MAIYKYSDEEINFIKANAEGMYNDDLAELFNQHFNVGHMTASKMKSLKANHKIKGNLKRKRKSPNETLLNKNQELFIKENYKGIGNEELTDRFNKEFNTSFTIQQLKSFKFRKGFDSGLTGLFEKGHVPIHKGTKGIVNVGGNKTSFKKGMKPHNYKPIGTERVNTDGYRDVKVSDVGPQQYRWKAKHVIIWEEANGPVPDGHVVIFLDADKTNITLENLGLVSRPSLSRLNRSRMIYQDPELTKVSINIVKLQEKVLEKERKDD